MAPSFGKIGQKGPHKHHLFGNESSNLCVYAVVMEIEVQSRKARDIPGQ